MVDQTVPYLSSLVSLVTSNPWKADPRPPRNTTRPGGGRRRGKGKASKGKKNRLQRKLILHTNLSVVALGEKRRINSCWRGAMGPGAGDRCGAFTPTGPEGGGKGGGVRGLRDGGWRV